MFIGGCFFLEVLKKFAAKWGLAISLPSGLNDN
jgi:hypothetical protein